MSLVAVLIPTITAQAINATSNSFQMIWTCTGAAEATSRPNMVNLQPRGDGVNQQLICVAMN